jgi:nucleoid DNA-binding protein
MDLSNYISELLFTHDRIVVPGFGTFSTKYISARLHPTKNTFEPPKKEILFTSSIKDDNGILAQHIAQKENLDEKEAKRKLEKSVKKFNLALSNGEKVTLEKIGVLSKKSDGTFVFKSDKSVNYLADSFGLEGFDIPDKINADVKKKREKRKTAPKPKPVRGKDKKV